MQAWPSASGNCSSKSSSRRSGLGPHTSQLRICLPRGLFGRGRRQKPLRQQSRAASHSEGLEGWNKCGSRAVVYQSEHHEISQVAQEEVAATPRSLLVSNR